MRRYYLLSLTVLLVASWAGAAVYADDPVIGSNRNTPEVIALKRVKDSVVNLRGKKTINDGAETVSFQQVKRVNGMGTGVVIDSRGYVLTNYHVIDGIQNLVVTAGEYSTTGDLVSYDPTTDLAIIKIRTSQFLPAIPFGISNDLMPAESVLAVGNAYGYTDTASRGIISALHRTVPVSDEQIYYDLIQTDASINPGNSGGPLINLDGQMIGVNVAVRVGAQGIGFAIPVNKALEVASELLSRENSLRIFHGITVETTYPNNVPVTEVSRVAPNSPAAQAGIQVGDQLVKVGEFHIQRQLDLQLALLEESVGSKVVCLVRRDGAEVSTNVELQPGRSSMIELVWDMIGIEVKQEVPSVVTQLNEKYAGGLRVEKVRPGSPAKNQGIQVGDILVGLHEWETVSLDDMNYIVSQPIVLQQPIQFYILRSKQAFFGNIRLQKSIRTAAK
ncbi:MAG: trypsin-like peptidase domain-containing protein [Planctomycetaceae bacterium]|nr:trypsin-like peptidase domain-containing protein [Planctomycetaceae bacterium]